ncbi:MAG: 2'-5' RNA ligase family protein [Clostridiaceae bacterium]
MSEYYAICLYFDNASSERLMELMRIAADACGNRYMLEPKMMPPHITVCYFTADDITPIEQVISNEAVSLKCGNVVWPSLGAFVPSVLFAAPTLNEYLANACTRFNAQLTSMVTLADYYRLYKWMPHTTLATKLTDEQLNIAFVNVSAKFRPFQGMTAALSLVKCEPFTELRVWQLEEKA